MYVLPPSGHSRPTQFAQYYLFADKQYFIFLRLKHTELSFFLMMCPAVKQTLAPAIKGVQVVSQSPLPAAQKSKEAAGGTFRFVNPETSQNSFTCNYHCGTF